MNETNLPLYEVLVIEDDPEIRRFLRTALGAEQYRLREAKTAAQGLRQAALPRMSLCWTWDSRTGTEST